MQNAIKVLYEDDCLIAFDKPSGLKVIPSGKDDRNTLTDCVNRQKQSLPVKLHPCHRLDKETSGVILYARGKKNQQLMMQLFHRRAVEKKYIALARGRLKSKRGVIDKPVADFHQKKFNHSARPKPAVTKFMVRAANKHYSILEAVPVTGRTHQIRIHLSQIGHPLLGERIYAYRKDFDVDFKRLALHACELTFRHPVSLKKIRILSPLAKDMENFIERC